MRFWPRRKRSSGGEGAPAVEQLVRVLRPANLSRAWKAAKNDRLVADWLSSGGDINQELKSQLPVLRSRAREAEQNSNLASRYLSLCETHIAGPDGFTLQVQGQTSSGEQQTETNNLIEASWRSWGARGVCEVTGQHSLPGLQRQNVRTTARDGEMLLRMHDVQPTTDNPWGFVVEQLDSTRLDHLLNDDLKNGHRIRLGIELTAAGRPVAYWLKNGERGGMASRRDSHTRVAADDIIHWFVPLRPEQLRGVPWMATGLLTLHQIDAFQEAAITAARAGASKMGFFTQQEQGVGPHMLADGRDADGELVQEFEPGVFGTLPKGYEFTSFDPRYPHEFYSDFLKAQIRDLATGWGVSYSALTGDLTDVNFSSTRTGTLEERERWKVLQESYSAAVLSRIYRRWLSAAHMHGQLWGDASRMQADQFLAIYGQHRFQGRRWSWVDPLKDIKATVEGITAGLLDPYRVAAEMGQDADEILTNIAKWQQAADTHGATLPAYQPKQSAPPQPENEEDDAQAA